MKRLLRFLLRLFWPAYRRKVEREFALHRLHGAMIYLACQMVQAKGDDPERYEAVVDARTLLRAAIRRTEGCKR